jgi:uncharacterized peroxidase-related enzyme
MNHGRQQNRIQPVDSQHAPGQVRRMFAEIQARLGLVPNLFRVLAIPPAALEGFMNLAAALATGALDERTRQRLALAIAESNLCNYCLSAHAFTAAKIGLSPVEINDAIYASVAEPQRDAILTLPRNIVVRREEISDSDLGRARTAGLSDAQIVGTIANVALGIFTNYVSHFARVPIDFPRVKDDSL